MAMCGRFALAASAEDIRLSFGVEVSELEPRYNIAPSQEVLLIASSRDGIIATRSTWGIRRSDGGLLINIRSETAGEKPHFRRMLERGRCIVPASGFFEWAQRSTRQPYYVFAEDSPLIAFAAVCTSDTDPSSGMPMTRCAILTRAANERIAALHHREPVVVPFALLDHWLNPDITGTDALATILAMPARWRYHAVSSRVGRVSNDDPHLLDPIDEPEPPLLG